MSALTAPRLLPASLWRNCQRPGLPCRSRLSSLRPSFNCCRSSVRLRSPLRRCSDKASFSSGCMLRCASPPMTRSPPQPKSFCQRCSSGATASGSSLASRASRPSSHRSCCHCRPAPANSTRPGLSQACWRCGDQASSALRPMALSQGAMAWSWGRASIWIALRCHCRPSCQACAGLPSSAPCRLRLSGPCARWPGRPGVNAAGNSQSALACASSWCCAQLPLRLSDASCSLRPPWLNCSSFRLLSSVAARSLPSSPCQLAWPICVTAPASSIRKALACSSARLCQDHSLASASSFLTCRLALPCKLPWICSCGVMASSNGCKPASCGACNCRSPLKAWFKSALKLLFSSTWLSPARIDPLSCGRPDSRWYCRSALIGKPARRPGSNCSRALPCGVVGEVGSACKRVCSSASRGAACQALPLAPGQKRRRSGTCKRSSLLACQPCVNCPGLSANSPLASSCAPSACSRSDRNCSLSNSAP